MGIINNTYFIQAGRGLSGRMPGIVTKLQALKNNTFFSSFFSHS